MIHILKVRSSRGGSAKSVVHTGRAPKYGTHKITVIRHDRHPINNQCQRHHRGVPDNLIRVFRLIGKIDRKSVRTLRRGIAAGINAIAIFQDLQRPIAVVGLDIEGNGGRNGTRAIIAITSTRTAQCRDASRVILKDEVNAIGPAGSTKIGYEIQGKACTEVDAGRIPG